MELVVAILLLSAGAPVWHAWLANHYTALAHTMAWMAAAWLSWTLSAWLAIVASPSRFMEYLALCLTACAIVALMGARRPGVYAWNFVVVGLLAVMLLPVAQRSISGGTLALDVLPALLLGSIFAVGLINFLPTRFWATAMLLFVACVWELLWLCRDQPSKASWSLIPGFAAACAPWMAWLAAHRPAQTDSQFDRVWLSFRDRFGLVWSQRLCDQFNRSAVNSGWPVVLTWKGLRRKPGAANAEPLVRQEMSETLAALMKRFL